MHRPGREWANRSPAPRTRAGLAPCSKSTRNQARTPSPRLRCVSVLVSTGATRTASFAVIYHELDSAVLGPCLFGRAFQERLVGPITHGAQALRRNAFLYQVP